MKPEQPIPASLLLIRFHLPWERICPVQKKWQESHSFWSVHIYRCKKMLKRSQKKSFERFIQIKENKRLKGLHIMIEWGMQRQGGRDKLQTSAFDILETKWLAQVIMIYEGQGRWIYSPPCLTSHLQKILDCVSFFWQIICLDVPTLTWMSLIFLIHLLSWFGSISRLTCWNPVDDLGLQIICSDVTTNYSHSKWRKRWFS